MESVKCPICNKPVKQDKINAHIDSDCAEHIIDEDAVQPLALPSIFQTPAQKRASSAVSKPPEPQDSTSKLKPNLSSPPIGVYNGIKRSLPQDEASSSTAQEEDHGHPTKKTKLSALQKVAPLAERMRPRTLDEVYGQELVGPNGVIRGLIADNRVPSMILWGGSGTGKTTIARLIAHTVGCRFVEINSTSSGVPEVKKLMKDAENELKLSGKKTIIFCDEIHRFNKSQQDVFLGPVESGQITLIGATTENPSFKVNNALLSRCRTFTLAKLSDETIVAIMKRALASVCGDEPPPLIDGSLLEYLAAFSDGDARTALNLLDISIDISKRPNGTREMIKQSLTQTLVYDRSGDQHYDTISAFHKSIRGSDPDAALYYLARMLQSGEDPLYIARRLVVIASEDIGLADSTMLPLAIAAYTAAEKVGLPEARISLAHATVAFAISPKSTKVYRALGAAMEALSQPGVAGLPVPFHLRNAPTKLLKELGHGKDYKYNPEYVDGRVVQEYFPEKLKGAKFLEDRHLGLSRDPDIVYSDEG